MKIKFLTVIASLFLMASMITSCLDSKEEEYVYSSDASIIAFSINNIETTHTEQVNGKDTTLTVTVVGTDYPFVIDQNRRLIYNVDSLPAGTDVSKVVVNITADNSYILIVAEDKDTLWTSTDSLNFEKPIKFKVIAPSTASGPVYQAKVNVHQQIPDSLMWTQINSNFEGNTIKSQKAVTLGERIYVFAEKTSQVAVTSTGINDGRSWSSLEDLNIPEKADYSSVMSWGDYLYIIAGTNLYRTTDAATWNKVETNAVLKQLISNTYSSNNKKLVAVDNENYIVESRDGSSWTKTEAVPANFPKTQLSYASYPLTTNPSIDCMVVMGNNEIAADTTAVTWAQLSTEKNWGDYTPEDNSTKYCPKLENLGMIYYNKQLYAFGGSGKKDGVDLLPFSSFYQSANNGVSWNAVTQYVLFPNQFSDLYKQASGNYSFVVDKNNFLWIMWSQSGEVWRGRINKLGFIQ